MTDYSGMKLGKRAATAPRARLMRDLLPSGVTERDMPPVPASLDRSGDVQSWPMLGNDRIGDCTIAAVGHAVQLWTAATGFPRVMSSTEAVLGYEAFGYQPGVPSSDQGANAQDVLTRWTDPGFEIAGAPDRLAGFCTIPPSEEPDVKAGIAWLGVVYAGLELPLAAQGMDTWDIGAVPLTGAYEPGSWGGHAVPLVGYGPDGVVCVTWGKTLRISWPFWRAYASEAYGLLSRDFSSDAVADETWNVLQADMVDLRSRVT